jgi:hypothetical protein
LRLRKESVKRPVEETRRDPPPEFANLTVDLLKPVQHSKRYAITNVDSLGVIERFTYSEITREAARWAQLLREKGLQPGERVAIVAGREWGWRCALLGAIHAGGVAVPCPASLSAREIGTVAEHADASLLVSLRPRPDLVELDGRTALTADDVDAIDPAHALEQPPYRTDPRDIALILYAWHDLDLTGTMHTHASLLAQADAAEHWLGVDEDERIWATVDDGSGPSIWLLLAAWRRAASIVVVDLELDSEAKLELLDRLRPAAVWFSDDEYRMLGSAEVPAWVDLRSIRRALVDTEETEGAISFATAFAAALVPVFALDELGVVAGWPAGHEGRADATTAQPIPGVQFAVVGRDGAELPPGEVGDVAVRSDAPTLFTGYAGKEGRSRSAEWFRFGWHGALTAEGALQIEARSANEVEPVGASVDLPVPKVAEEPAPEEEPVAAEPEPAALGWRARRSAERARREEERAAEDERRRQEEAEARESAEREAAEAAERERAEAEERREREEAEAREGAAREAAEAEERRLQQQAEARARAEAEERRLREEAEAEARERAERKAAAEARRAEDERLAEEHRAAEQEKQREEEQRQRAEEEARRRAEQGAKQRAAAEADERRRVEAEAKQRAEEEKFREEDRAKVEAEERRRAEEHAKAQQAVAAAEAKQRAEREKSREKERQLAEKEAHARAEREAKEREKAEAEERRRAEEEAKIQAKREEAEAKQRAKEEREREQREAKERADREKVEAEAAKVQAKIDAAEAKQRAKEEKEREKREAVERVEREKAEAEAAKVQAKVDAAEAKQRAKDEKEREKREAVERAEREKTEAEAAKAQQKQAEVDAKKRAEEDKRRAKEREQAEKEARRRAEEEAKEAARAERKAARKEKRRPREAPKPADDGQRRFGRRRREVVEETEPQHAPDVVARIQQYGMTAASNDSPAEPPEQPDED